MDVQAKEIQGSYNWILFAGGLAVVLSCVLFWVDNTVMGGAAERDREHAAQMRELRMAQSGLAARVTDSRQTLPLVLEQQDHKAKAAESNHSEAH
jgi:hypothetical protein